MVTGGHWNPGRSSTKLHDCRLFLSNRFLLLPRKLLHVLLKKCWLEGPFQVTFVHFRETWDLATSYVLLVATIGGHWGNIPSGH